MRPTCQAPGSRRDRAYSRTRCSSPHPRHLGDGVQGRLDVRESLAYKLKRILEFKATRVLSTDPYVTADPWLLPLEEVLARSDVLVVATPHPQYRNLATDLPVADGWNVLGQVYGSDPA